MSYQELMEGGCAEYCPLCGWHLSGVIKRAATHSETDFDAKSHCEQGKQHCGVWWCSTTTPVPPKVISMSKISYLMFFGGNANTIKFFLTVKQRQCTAHHAAGEAIHANGMSNALACL